MSDFHLVTSPSAAGSLRWAIQHHGLSGEVHCIMDSLDLGPLANGRERAAFWRSFNEGYFSQADNPKEILSEDAFAPWEKLRELVASRPPDRLLLWVSGSGADHVFLRMACHRLVDTGLVLARVPVPPLHGLHGVAVHTPEDLATYVRDAAIIPERECSRLAAEFISTAARPELLRACDDSGRLMFLDLAAHDEFIVAKCTSDWQIAARVVGEVMGTCDPRNPLGDGFVNSRLQHLIKTGRIDADNPGAGLRACRVRLPR